MTSAPPGLVLYHSAFLYHADGELPTPATSFGHLAGLDTDKLTDLSRDLYEELQRRAIQPVMNPDPGLLSTGDDSPASATDVIKAASTGNWPSLRTLTASELHKLCLALLAEQERRFPDLIDSDSDNSSAHDLDRTPEELSFSGPPGGAPPPISAWIPNESRTQLGTVTEQDEDEILRLTKELEEVKAQNLSLKDDNAILEQLLEDQRQVTDLVKKESMLLVEKLKADEEDQRQRQYQPLPGTPPRQGFATQLSHSLENSPDYRIRRLQQASGSARTSDASLSSMVMPCPDISILPNGMTEELILELHAALENLITVAHDPARPPSSCMDLLQAVDITVRTIADYSDSEAASLPVRTALGCLRSVVRDFVASPVRTIMPVILIDACCSDVALSVGELLRNIADESLRQQKSGQFTIGARLVAISTTTIRALQNNERAGVLCHRLSALSEILSLFITSDSSRLQAPIVLGELRDCLRRTEIFLDNFRGMSADYEVSENFRRDISRLGYDVLNVSEDLPQS